MSATGWHAPARWTCGPTTSSARRCFKARDLGSFEAFHLKPRPIANPRGNITVEMWFAPSLQYLPVRIRVNMGEGTYLELTVVKIEQR